MAKLDKKNAPQLIIERSVDEKTGHKIITRRRGVLCEQTRIVCDGSLDWLGYVGGEDYCGAMVVKSIRQKLEEEQEVIRFYLERKNIPSGRTPSYFVSIDGEPFRAAKENETFEHLPAHNSFHLISWNDLANTKTEPLSLERSYVDYLTYLELVLNKFNNEDLGSGLID